MIAGLQKAMQRYAVHLAAVIAMIVVAVAIGGYILSNQRFFLPGWVPVIGTNFYTVNAEFPTLKAVTPGQGQTVNIAGVPIGEIGSVKLKNGNAVVEMKIQPKYTPIYKDATLLLRPKTPLDDMFVELKRGHPSAGKIPEGGTIPLANTKANVTFDQILNTFDTDSRDYLQLLFNSAGEGLNHRGKDLAAAFKRFLPTARDGAKIASLLEARRHNIKRGIHNFGLLARALGDNQKLVAEFIDSGNAMFTAFAAESASIRSFIAKAPGALGETASALQEANKAAADAGPAFKELQPFARDFGDAMRGLQPFFKSQATLTKNVFRPFSVKVQPLLQQLAPGSENLKELTPDSVKALTSFNNLLNTVSYQKRGGQEGYLAWLAWFSHLSASLFSRADAHGIVRSGVTVGTCASLKSVNGFAATALNDPTLNVASGPFAVLAPLLNLPNPASCP